MSDVIKILVDGRARFPHIAVTHDGKSLPSRHFTSEKTLNGVPAPGFVDATRIETLLQDGSSVVFNELETYWPPLTAIAGRIAGISGIEVGAMAFLSAPNSGAFPLHQDPTHVIVVQCAGTKHWQVYEHVDGQDAPGPVTLEKLSTPMHSMTLSPGDVFSMPSGHPHLAQSASNFSLHVSLTAATRDGKALLKSNLRAAIAALPEDHRVDTLTEQLIGALRKASVTPRPSPQDQRDMAVQRLTSLLGAGEG
jgi:ribosomal protein L16 Arg81 hydroxylase